MNYEEKEALMATEPVSENWEQVDENNKRPLAQVWENENYTLTITHVYRDPLPSNEWAAILERNEVVTSKQN